MSQTSCRAAGLLYPAESGQPAKRAEHSSTRRLGKLFVPDLDPVSGEGHVWTLAIRGQSWFPLQMRNTCGALK